MHKLNAPGIRSIHWLDDGLIDWVGGGTFIGLDGRVQPNRVNYAYRFDAAVQSICGTYAVIYERLGTKGLVLKYGKVLREINRSYYQAHRYEYPIAVLQTGAGRWLLAHCPDGYNRLELDDLETGERLSALPSRQPRDYFHSRLRASADGRWLLSAGWVWHPWNTVEVFDIARALNDPSALDEPVPLPRMEAEVCAAEFLPSGRLVVSTNAEDMDDPQERTPNSIGPTTVAVIDVASGLVLSTAQVQQPTGTLMALDASQVIGFYEHPKLISLVDGSVKARWEHIRSGTQLSSIALNHEDWPVIACDPDHRRLAVVNGEWVHAVELPGAES